MIKDPVLRAAWFRAYSKGRYSGLKRALFAVLGDQCAKCFEDDARLLEVDHVRGGGRAHRARHANGPSYYLSILRILARDRRAFRLLCVRCHTLRGNNR